MSTIANKNSLANRMKEPMPNRRIVNVTKARQCDLAIEFPWLMDVDLNVQRSDVQILSVSVFDHWLPPEEAIAKLENISSSEQSHRNDLLADFCSRMIAATEVLSFVQRGRQDRRLIFRRFVSQEVRSEYCRPGGGRVLSHRHFHVILPEFNCAFYEGWDDTCHFFFTRPDIAEVAQVWARQSGVFLLGH